MARSTPARVPDLDLDIDGGSGLSRAVELRGRSVGWGLVAPGLEAVLPDGLPRGRVTEWAGPRSAGKTAALRRLVGATLDRGVGTAYVDATGTLAPAPWVGEVERGALFWVVRPPAAPAALIAAEELLRSGAFGLVIAEGADWRRTPVIRLQRLAGEAATALVAVVDRAGRLPLAGLRVTFEWMASTRRRVRLRGRGSARELIYVQDLPYRLPADSGFPDRRASPGRG